MSAQNSASFDWEQVSQPRGQWYLATGAATQINSQAHLWSKDNIGQKAYLRVLIEVYIPSRKESFSDQPPKPKQHYLCHYSGLTIRFGPLIHLWASRFKSKHTYFKQCASKLHNFKNLCSTLLQAYLSRGYILQPSIAIEKGTDFFFCTRLILVIGYKNQLPP